MRKSRHHLSSALTYAKISRAFFPAEVSEKWTRRGKLSSRAIFVHLGILLDDGFPMAKISSLRGERKWVSFPRWWGKGKRKSIKIPRMLFASALPRGERERERKQHWDSVCHLSFFPSPEQANWLDLLTLIFRRSKNSKVFRRLWLWVILSKQRRPVFFVVCRK